MARPAPRELQVIRRTAVSEHMLRVTLGGEGLDTFPADQESAYIKLIFPQDNGDKPLMRTYTVRQQRNTEIDVDFAIHEHQGPASIWAASAEPGDRVLIAGPGPKRLINQNADWYLLAGDMTSLPAISVNLGLLPADARGYAVIEVPSKNDIQALKHPANMELHWVVTSQQKAKKLALPETVELLPWLSGQASIWAACEFSSMQVLRRYFKNDRAMPRSHLYISSYWQQGQTEDLHKLAKQTDSA